MLDSRDDKISGIFRDTSASYNKMSEMPQVSFLTLDGKYHVRGQDAVYYTDDNGTERFVEGGASNGLTVDLYLTEEEWACVLPTDDGYGPDFILRKYIDGLCDHNEEIASVEAQECEDKMCVNGEETPEHNDMDIGKWNFPCVSAWSIEEFLESFCSVSREILQRPKEVNHHHKETSHTSQNKGELMSAQFEKDHPDSQDDESQRWWGDDQTIYMSESDLDEQLQLLGHDKVPRLSRYDLHHGPVHDDRSPSRPLIGSRGDSKERIVLDGEDSLETSLPLYTIAGAGHNGKGVQKAAPKAKLLRASVYKKQSLSVVIVDKICFTYIGFSCWLLLMGLPSLCTIADGLQKFGKRGEKAVRGSNNGNL
ncbi:Hypp359 [Branchiostoma lanceolatum]|uniref:Hypp359 protein n=1 Tax=Branchiostoma lanceolatum TaxID=7740 RepID=A0A8J9V9C9_BRALA|nr:Hypp359 [Branchiostoma lanceolatum]